MSYAIFKTGGKQYRVGTGEILTVEKLDGEKGARVEFKDVLAVGEGENLKVSDLAGASVAAEILDQVKGDKVIAYKYRRRKGYHRTVGHRQKLTQVKITEISA
jgi:large subunit ribosomal protein L21